MLSPFPSRDIAPPPPKNLSSSLQDSLPGAHLASCHLSCAFTRAESRAGKWGRRQPLEIRWWGWGYLSCLISLARDGFRGAGRAAEQQSHKHSQFKPYLRAVTCLLEASCSTINTLASPCSKSDRTFSVLPWSVLPHSRHSS